MLFVIDKPAFQRVISIVRDDRKKESRGLRGPFMRLEANKDEDYVKLDGLEASAQIPATVYEAGVLFLKVTMFRRLLQTFKGEKFLSIQVMADGLLMNHLRLPLESNEMLLYADPDQAPQVHPSIKLLPPVPPKPKPSYRQLWLWDEDDTTRATDHRKGRPF